MIKGADMMEQLGRSKKDGFKERCQQICSDIDLCFIGNNKQITCISDMVINKVCAVKVIVDRLREDNHCKETAKFLDMAYEDVDDLINWVRYLEAVQTRR